MPGIAAKLRWIFSRPLMARMVGLLLLATGVQKVLKPDATATTIHTLVTFSDSVIYCAVGCLAVAEIAVGFQLLRFPLKDASLKLGMLLFGAFTIYLVYLSTLAHPPSCGCSRLLEWFVNERANAVAGILRNMFILGCLLLVLKCRKGVEQHAAS